MEKLLPSYLGVLVAVFVATIGLLQYLTARKQWRTAHNRGVLDQFERRYQVYKELREVVGAIAGSSQAAHDGFIKAQEAAERAKFLFGDDVVSYVNQLVRDVTDLSSVISELKEAQGEERSAGLKAERRLRDSVEKFRTEGTELFAHYIRFADKIE